MEGILLDYQKKSDSKQRLLQSNKKWFNNGKINKQIHIDDPILEGFIRGRLLNRDIKTGRIINGN